MGKNNQRFNKKQSVRFTLVPGFDENGRPITLYRPLQQYKSKLNLKQRQKIIKQISDQQYDQIQINGKKVLQNQIPSFILQQIKGRKDLIWNQKNQQKQTSSYNNGSKQTNSYNNKQTQGDMYEIRDIQQYEQQQIQGQQWIDDQQIIDQQNQSYDSQQQYTDQQDVQQDQDNNTNKRSQKFQINQQQFPVLKSKVNIDGKQYQFTQQQIKLLDVLIPQNYQQFQIKGLTFQKYGQDGLPLSKKHQYQQWLPTGKQGVVDTYVFVPDKPTNIYDNDLKPNQIKGQLKQIQDALNFSGQEDAYEQMDDDFFADMVKNQIKINTKQNNKKKQKKTISKNIKPQPKNINEQKIPKILAEQKKNQNIFAKYDQLDNEDLNQQLTDQMLQKALDDFQNNLQPIGKYKANLQQQLEQQMQQYNSSINRSMNYSEIQNRQEYIGRDGELDWRCLSKKQKKEYMKTKIIRDFYDQVRERQINDKLKGKKNVTAEQLHLKTMIKHLPYEEDHVMRKALQQDAKQEVNFDQESDYQTSSQDQDIVQYRQRTSVISSSLNQISQTSKRKKKKVRAQNGQQRSQLDQLSASISQLKIVPEKRNRRQTSQERKERKEKLRDLKKNKRQLKKQFADKFGQQRRKAMKMNKPADPLHKVAYVKII